MTENDRASAPVRILYKPWGVIAGVAGGMIAGTVFKRVWRLVRGEDEVPGAIDPARSWTETAFAAALEGAVFGVAALLQRIAIGIATAILGWTYASSGYVANVQQSAHTLTAMRATVALVPLLFLALSGIAMIFNPLGRSANRRAAAQVSSETAA